MEIKIRTYNSIYIIDVSGEMDLYNSYRLKEIVQKMMAKKIDNYIINLENLTYIDSSGVGALIFVNATLKQNNMPLRIVNVNGSVKKVIELTKLVGYLPLAESLQSAIKEILEDKG